MTDNDIIELLKNDRYSRAVKGLYAAFPLLKKHVLANNGNKEDAEDVFQEILLIVYKKAKAEELVLTSSLRTYMLAIGKNLWYAELRKRGKEVSTVDVPEMLPGTEINQEPEMKRAEMAFRLLGEKCREMLILFYFKKKSMQSIASSLGFGNEKVAKNQKYRCIQKAKENYVDLLNA